MYGAAKCDKKLLYSSVSQRCALRQWGHLQLELKTLLITIFWTKGHTLSLFSLKTVVLISILMFRKLVQNKI